MTISATRPAAARPTALPTPTVADVLTLQSLRGYPAVSVLCGTEPAPMIGAPDVARLSALAGEAVRRIEDEFGPSAASVLRAQLDELCQDVARRPTKGAVALFLGDQHRSAWSLPVSVGDRVVVDPTFATRDLVWSLHRTPRHLVLVLTEQQARLFGGVADTLSPPPGSPFPLYASRTRSPGAAPRNAPSKRPVEASAGFLRTVDDALGAYLRIHNAPLVLVGTTRTVSRFRDQSRHLQRLAGTVPGSHARTDLRTLQRLIRPVLDRYLRSRQDEALGLLEARASSRRVVSGVHAVWLAARAERPEMLAVEQGLFYPARVSEDGDFLTPADDVDHPEVLDDAVDEIIETVLQRGGWVALIEDGVLGEHHRIALTLRAPA